MDSKCEYSPNIYPFEPFHCVTIKSNLLDYSKQSVCYQYWTNPNSNHHLVSIVRLESLSFVNVQYVIVGSLVIIMMMMIEMNGWLIETAILIQYHCKNNKEIQHNQACRIDILLIIESWIGIKNRFETNKKTLNRNVTYQWLITEQFSIIDLLLDLMDKISENGRNIYEWNQINQTLLEIDFDRTYWNGRSRLTFWRFGISKDDQYSIVRNTFQCHWTRTNEITSPSRIDDGC